MMVFVVSSEKEFDAVKEETDKHGHRLACVSNTGLPLGKSRVTFLPVSAFKDAPKQTD